MYDIIVFENLLFRASTRKREAGVLKNVHSEDCFPKPAFFHLPKPGLRVDGRLKQRKKNSFCKNIRLHVDGALSLTFGCSCLERTK